MSSARFVSWTTILLILCSAAGLAQAQMAMRGSLEVTPSGAATYSIPLTIPPGTADVRPSLGLVYNSHGQNGAFGLGWSLSGLSVISRCPARTFVFDASHGGVAYDISDRLCLDGQRLIPVSRNYDNYGGNGVEYRPEMGTFSKIISYGQAGNGPQWFKVWTKAGEVIEYGGSVDSRVTAQGQSSIRVWPVSKVSDAKGNYIDFSYLRDQNNGEYYISRITYTGNVAAGVMPNAEVFFQYEPRPDAVPTYLGGSLIRQTLRVSAIRTKVGVEEARVYELDYDVSYKTFSSRLTSVRECSGQMCLPEIAFSYPVTAEYDFAQSTWVGHDRGANNSFTADFDGDGRTDLLGYVSGNQWRMCKSSGVGFSCSTWIGHDQGADRNTIGDFNGDGRADIAGRYASDLQARWIVCLSSGNSFSCSEWKDETQTHADPHARSISGDFNGDGRSDLARQLVAATWQVCYSTGSDFSCSHQPGPGTSSNLVREADFNGDGRTDLARHVSGTTWEVCTTTGRWDVGLFQCSNWSGHSGGLSDNAIGDFNGDGLADIATQASGTTWSVCLSTGKNFACGNWDGVTSSANSTIVADYTGDGRSDFAVLQSGQFNVCQSTGTTFYCSTWAPGSSKNNTVSGDFNGDGSSDLAEHTGGTQWRVSRSIADSADAMLRADNGIGDVRTITYKVLTDSSVYTRLNGAIYPISETIAPVRVVSSVAGSNGIGGTVTTSYKYGGLRTNHLDRMALGFAWTENVQSNTQAKVRTDFRQDWPYAGLPALVKKWSGTSLLSESEYTYSCKSADTSSCGRGIARFYFPYQSSRVERSWDLDGSALPEVTTNTQFDDYGNSTYFETLYSDGHSKKTTNTIINDVAGWKLGRLTRSEVVSEAPGVPAQTRTSAFAYFDSDGLLTREVVEPDYSALCVVNNYVHDAFGNQTQTVTRNCSGAALQNASEAPAPTGDAVFTARTSVVGYDVRGQFPTSSQNALAHAESRTFDPMTGNVLTLTGPNQLTTEWQYDALGRKLLEIRSDGNRTRWRYAYCAGTNGGGELCPTHGKYVIEESPRNSFDVPNGPWMRSYFDSADRAISVETVGFDGVSPVVETTEYDALGRVWRKSRPHYVSNQPAWTRHFYDSLGRVIKVIRPDNSETITVYAGLTTIVTNDLNQTESRTVNSQGQVVLVRDAENNEISYAYDANGNLLTTTDPSGNVVTMTYDRRGRKKQMVDPDMGTWAYEYNALGELVRQTDAKSQVTRMVYDRLGRMTRRIEPGLTSDWHYDRYPGGLLGAQIACGKGIGRLCRAESNSGYKRTYNYDDLGRVDRTLVTIALVNYATEWTYDANGRVLSMDYPKPALALLPFGVTYNYTDLGFLSEIRDRAGDNVYWEAEEMDAEGRLTRQSYGNGHSTERLYDPLTGRLSDIIIGGGVAQSWSYEYDTIGNLKTRSDSESMLTETFTYDALNRIETSTVSSPTVGSSMISYDYDALGNITARSDVGSYIYNTGLGAIRPHAVDEITSVGGGKREFTYDANGNLTQEVQRNAGGTIVPAQGRNVVWSGYNQPLRIEGAGSALTFTYGPEHQRIQHRKAGGLLAERTTVYVHPDNAGGLHFEKDTEGLSIEHRYYIVAAGQLVAIAKRRSNNAGVLHGFVTLDYVHQDNLGSVTAVGGTEVLAYEPFGKRRFPDGQSDPGGQLVGDATNRGFTGHEHLDDVGLIHMNGRVYDPRIGRFMSPDPIIQASYNLQSFNRYSYAVNNPLAYVDPSGYSWWGDLVDSFSDELKRWERDFRHEIRRPGSLLGPILRVAGAAVSVLACGPGSPGCYAAINAATEAGVSRAQGVTGSDLLRNVAVSGATAYGFGYVGMSYDPGTFASYAGHAIIGCGSAAAAGGNCGQGAAAAFVGKVTTVNTPGLDPTFQFGVAVVAGGTASVITGGKFANGAVTASFGYLLNHLASFDGKRLTLYDDEGNVVGEWGASSGRPGTGAGDQSAAGAGPIPEGRYVARQARLQFRSQQSLWGRVKSFFGGGTWPGGYRSWGNSRIWLDAAPGTNTHGRSGFSIHGGLVPGSAGCIDLCQAMPAFTRQFQQAGHDVDVVVDY